MENHEHISNEELVKMDNMSLEKWLKAEQGFLDDDKARTAVRLFFGAQEGFDWDMDFSALQAALMVHSRLRTFNRTGMNFFLSCFSFSLTFFCGTNHFNTVNRTGVDSLSCFLSYFIFILFN